MNARLRDTKRSLTALAAEFGAKVKLSVLSAHACGEHRGWLSQQTHRFVSKTIEQFGRTTEPIKVRRAA